MDSGHGNSYDTLYFDNHATVTCAFHLQKYPLLPLKFTAGNPDFGTFGQVQFIRLKIKKMIIVSAGYGNETLHLTVGDNNLLPTAGIGDILQISDLRLDTLHIGRTGMDKKQIMNDRNQSTDLFPFFILILYCIGMKQPKFSFLSRYMASGSLR